MRVVQQPGHSPQPKPETDSKQRITKSGTVPEWVGEAFIALGLPAALAEREGAEFPRALPPYRQRIGVRVARPRCPILRSAVLVS